MDKKLKVLVKNTGILTISNFSSKILVFLLVPLYTSILTTEEYGTYDLVSTTIQLLIPILSVNMYEGVMRFVMDDKADRSQAVTIGFWYCAVGSAIFGVFILVNRIFRLWAVVADYSIYVFLYFICSLFNQLATQTSKGFERISDMAVGGLISTVITLTLNIVFLVKMKLALKGFFLAYILGQLAPALFLMIRLRVWKYLVFKVDRELKKDMTSYSAPLIMNTLGWWANSASDRYVVTGMCGIDVNGIYSVSYKIPSILNILQGIFIQAWQVSAIREYGLEDASEFYGKALHVINTLMCFACSVLVVLTIPIATFFYQKEFFSAWQYVPFLLVSSVINAASGVLGPILSAQKNSKALGRSALVGSGANVVLNVLLVWLMGAQGAAVATAISSLIIYMMRKRAAGEDVIYVDYHKLVISWILLTVQALFMIYTKLYWVQAIAVAALFLLFINDIKTILNMVKSFLTKIRKR